ncbi:MAG: hypothetical protein IPP98_06840 [Gemmatimonadetes bacterium]|nr:hypothetical protein [Gemmatimonadota bacterium]
MIQKMFDEGMTNGQAGKLAQVLMDSIGPRLTGSPRQNAANWAVKPYASWGIPAEKRAVRHLELVAARAHPRRHDCPRVRSLEGTMPRLGPGTGGKDVIGDVILFPETKSPDEFAAWAKAKAKGKFVLISAPLASCRRRRSGLSSASRAPPAARRAQARPTGCMGRRAPSGAATSTSGPRPMASPA